MIRRRTLLLGAATIVLSGCGNDKPGSGPPEITYGKAVCARCGMIISEERYAAGLSGEPPQLFDDTGELVVTVQEQGLSGRKVWVHDYDTKAWIDGTTASYAMLPDRRTPMGTGVIAFKERQAAEEFAAQNAGHVMTWDEIQTNWSMG